MIAYINYDILVTIRPSTTLTKSRPGDEAKQDRCMSKFNALNIYYAHTLLLPVAIHTRHFLSENPTPSLKPPIKLLAGVSPNIHNTAP